MHKHLLWICLLIASFPYVFAEGTAEGSIDFTAAVTYVQLCTFWIVLMAVVLMAAKDHVMEHKKFFFWLLVVPIILTTFFLAGSTVAHNLSSETKGPVHWHADFQVWVCDEKLDLVDPSGFSNKIGTPLFHEHNDDRIHVEGTVDSVEDVNVGAFFRTIGAQLTPTSLQFPVNEDQSVVVANGDTCGSSAGELKAYVNGVRIENPQDYMYYPHPGVPPGDCIIVEFGTNLGETTERICDFWSSNDWNYDNFKELRQKPNNGPVWNSPDWEYIDGKGMVRTNG